MRKETWKWVLGLAYIFAVATIWIAASFVVQSVVDDGVSPFLVTYICNSLFVVYIPIFEIGRYLEDKYGSILFWRNNKDLNPKESRVSEQSILLADAETSPQTDALNPVAFAQSEFPNHQDRIGNLGLDSKGHWSRSRVAKVSLLICPFWFLAQLTFNLSLKYTTVTSNTILSSSSSLFTFLVALIFLGEKFTWLKMISVLLCMGGTIIVSLGDSETESNTVASKPVIGDILSLVSASFYAVYITLIRLKLPDEDDEKGHASMALFLGFLGLFNFIIFLPIALILEFTKMESFTILTWKQFGLIVGKGLLDNVLSDYLWAKAVLLTTTTVATAGLTIQVPLAAIVDTVIGNTPNILDYIGAAAVMVGFAGINIPFNEGKEASLELENQRNEIQ